MRALVYHGPADVRFESVPDPLIESPDGCVVRIERSAICGSDLHIYHGQMGPATGYTIGHECVGEVVERGSRVRRFAVGDRVLVSAVVGCGQCSECLAGRVTSCESSFARVFGTNQGLGGAQAEALAVPAADASMCKIPDGVSDEQALTLTDILPTGYFGAKGAAIEPGQDVAVVGLGPVGLMALMSARLFGPARIFAIDSVPARLERARALGAIPIDYREGGLARVAEATSGHGPHAVIEAVGSRESILSCLQLVRRGGIVSVVGVNAEPAFPFPMGLALVKGVRFSIGICPVTLYWRALVPLVQSGHLEPQHVFTHRFPLAQGPKAYELFASRADGVQKVLFSTGAPA